MNVFRGTKSVNQVTGAAFEEITFPVEDFDTGTVFDSNRFTVPAYLNDKYFVLFGSVKMSANVSEWLIMEVSTDGGSTWARISMNYGNSGQTNGVSSGLCKGVTGDIYRVIWSDGGQTVQTDERTFFSGYILS